MVEKKALLHRFPLLRTAHLQEIVTSFSYFFKKNDTDLTHLLSITFL